MLVVLQALDLRRQILRQLPGHLVALCVPVIVAASVLIPHLLPVAHLQLPHCQGENKDRPSPTGCAEPASHRQPDWLPRQLSPFPLQLSPVATTCHRPWLPLVNKVGDNSPLRQAQQGEPQCPGSMRRSPPASEHWVSYCHSGAGAEPAPLAVPEDWPEPNSFGSGRGGVGGGAEAGSVGCGGAVMASISCEKNIPTSASNPRGGKSRVKALIGRGQRLGP